VFCQETIQPVREGLPFLPAEARRTAPDFATISQLIHQDRAVSQPSGRSPGAFFLEDNQMAAVIQDVFAVCKA
jgi:hypothetical protein